MKQVVVYSDTAVLSLMVIRDAVKVCDRCFLACKHLSFLFNTEAEELNHVDMIY